MIYLEHKHEKRKEDFAMAWLFEFENGKKYTVVEEDLQIARCKLAKMLIQMDIKNYWLKKSNTEPPNGSIEVIENVYLLKHKESKIKLKGE